MELRSFGDSKTPTNEKNDKERSLTFDASISKQTTEALKLVDANIRYAEQNSGSIYAA